MDNKTLCTHIAKAMNVEQSVANTLLSTFATIIKDRAANLDSIAIPAFGNFVAIKLPERIVADSQTCKRILYPPQIKIEFVASAMLKKQIAND